MPEQYIWIELADRAEQCVLRWFGHMERMEENQLVKRIIGSDVRGVRLRKLTNRMNRHCEKSFP